MFPILISFIATIASVFIILVEFKSFVSYELLLGVFGAALGVVVAYTFARIKEATDSPKIFISYAHEDQQFVDKLYEELHSSPYEILIDKHEIHVGDNIKEKLDEMLVVSDYVLFVGSKNSIDSNWASIEIEKAKKLKKKILPLKIDETNMPEFIRDTMYADFSGSYEDGIVSLIRALKATRHNKSKHTDAA